LIKIIGGILFAIGVFLLLPFDEILILIPLVAFYGLSVIPIYYAIALSCLIIGALIMGIHVVPWLFKHPIGIVMLLIALGIILYIYL